MVPLLSPCLAHDIFGLNFLPWLEGKERKENSVQGLRDQVVCFANHGIKKYCKEIKSKFCFDLKK